jgi:hypothetical protein
MYFSGQSNEMVIEVIVLVTYGKTALKIHKNNQTGPL